MKEKIIKDLYCFQCSLQFDKKSIYDMHLLIVHNYKVKPVSIETEIKSEPEDSMSYKSTDESDTKRTEKQDLETDPSIQNTEQENEEIKFKICDNSFASKQNLNTHIATVHKAKRQFQCKIKHIFMTPFL